jgi:hypothetical protein
VQESLLKYSLDEQVARSDNMALARDIRSEISALRATQV